MNKGPGIAPIVKHSRFIINCCKVFLTTMQTVCAANLCKW